MNTSNTENTQELSKKKKLNLYSNKYKEINKENIKAQQKCYREANKEKIKDRQKASYVSNKEKINAQQKCYREANKEKIKDRQKAYRQANREKAKHQQREYFLKNKNKILESRRDYVKERCFRDDMFNLKSILRNNLSAAFRRIKKNKPTNTIKLLGCTWEEAKVHFELLFQEGMTWDNHGKWHIDHIRPVSSFTEEDIHMMNHISNLQPLWAKDNLIKSDGFI